MTPKPESETDPWADVEAAYADIAVNKTARVYLADVVESARAAEAAQHRQAIAAKDAHIKAVEGVLREHGEFGDLFQPGGRFHREANLLLGGSAVADGGRWLVARLAAVEAERDNQYTQAVEATQRALLAEAERDRLKAALQDVTTGMDRAGGDRDGMPECPWCQSQGHEDAEEGYAHDGDCSLMMARAALTPQGQSTDGETK